MESVTESAIVEERLVETVHAAAGEDNQLAARSRRITLTDTNRERALALLTRRDL